MINTLEEALNYISELEAENKALRAELKQFRSRKPSGRKNTMMLGWPLIMTL